MYLSIKIRPAFFILLTAQVVVPTARAADLFYSDTPLSLQRGVQPNVALMIDTSGSMGATDTSGTGNITSVCNGMSIAQPMTRMNAAKEAACRAVQDNANSMRIGLYRFTGGNNGLQVQPIQGNTAATLKTSITGLIASGGTPLTSAMDVIAKDYVGAASPLQYRCQKNHVVFFSDGAPTTGADLSSSLLYPALFNTQTSNWYNSTAQSGASSSIPGWDGFLDPLYNPDGTNVYPWLDDLTQFAYDVDIKGSTSTTSATVCPNGTAPFFGMDCAGKSWDGEDDIDGRFAQQNIVTYTVGFGSSANSSLMRNAPLVNQVAIAPANINTTEDTINIVSHGLKDGQFVHYYKNWISVNSSTTATGNIASDLLGSADTTNMMEGSLLTYSDQGGTALEYVTVPAVPAVPAITCSDANATMGLTSGSTYYVANRSATTFRLAASAANADLCDNYSDGNSSVSIYCIDLTDRSLNSLVHTFTRVTVPVIVASFTADGSGSTPVDINTNTEKFTFTANHNLSTQDLVTYTCSGGTPAVPGVPGVTSTRSTYYARNVTVGNPGSFQLSLTQGGAPVDIAIAGNPSQSFSWTGSVAQSMVGGLYAYETDAAADATPNPPTESAARGKYYVEYVNADKFKLRQCGNAVDCTTEAASTVDITSTGYGRLSTGPGKSFFSTTAVELTAAMNAAFADIAKNNGAVVTSASVISTPQLTENQTLYQAQYNSADWSGDVTAFPVDPLTRNVGSVPNWTASANTPIFNIRTMLTWNPTIFAGATVGSVVSLTAAQKISLNTSLSAADQQKVLDWVLGKDDATLPDSRVRSHGVYGDIIGSSPRHIGQPDQDYDTVLTNGTPGKSSYLAFKATLRIPMIYVGGNDGMLHGVDANTGTERVGFIPNGVFTDWLDLNDNGLMDAGTETNGVIKKFYELTRQDYGTNPALPHRYFVDGEATSGDAFFSSAIAGFPANSWHTILVGGLGKGGRSVYALDVTDPSTFNTSKVLWEFNDNNSGRMGYSYSKPVITRLQNGQWAAIFGNGYDGASDLGHLFVVNLEDGSIIKRLDAPGSKGLSTVTLLKDTTDTVVSVYAGDLAGNVWKFDLSYTDPFIWTDPGAPLFVAQDNFGNRQAITSPITLGSGSPTATCAPGSYCAMLYFGTGTYFQNSDRYYDYVTATPKHDTFYALYDNGSGNINSDKSTLVQQTLSSIVFDGVTYRSVTANVVNYATARGWYVNLSADGIYEGERITFAPTLAADAVFFTTMIPSGNDPCDNVHRSWLMGLNAFDGNMRAHLMDTNGDGIFDNADAQIAGKEIQGGLSSRLAAQITTEVAVNPDGSTTTQDFQDLYISTIGGGSTEPVIHERVLLNAITLPGPNGSVKNDYNADGIAGWIWKGISNGHETESQNWQLTFPLYSPNWGVPNRFYTPIFPDQANWEIVTSGDFNKDGDADILWRHKTLAAWKVWQMQNGLRTAQNTPADFDLAHEWTVIGAGDTDKDGDDDVIFSNSISGDVMIWQIQDYTVVSYTISNKAGYTLNRIGDFDKDGDVDLLFRQNGADVLIIWEIESNFFVQAYALANTGTNYQPVCAGDFDNDNDDDIMLVNSSTMQEKWFVMENFARTQVVGSTNTGFVFKGCGDYDGDGDADMLWQRSADDANRVILQQNYGVTKQTVYTNAFGGANGFVYRGNSN